MLTLGLMEGIFTFVATTMVILILVEHNAPIDRFVAPPALVLSAVIAYAVYATEAAHGVAEVTGLLVGFLVMIVAPLAVLRYAWKATSPRPVEQRTPPARVEQLPPTEQSGVSAAAPHTRVA